MHDKKENTCLLIVIAIPDESHVNRKETDKLSKYKDLDMAVSRMWKVRTKTVPVITGALGTIRKGLHQNCQLLPSHLLTMELQKIMLMSTAHVICKVLGENCSDLFFRSGLTRRLPPNN